MGSHVHRVGVTLWYMGISGEGLLVSMSLGLELVEPAELPGAGYIGGWWLLAHSVPLLLSPYPQDCAKDVRML